MSKLIAESLSSDPRLFQLKKQILSLVEEYQRQITGIKAPDPHRTMTYEKLIKEFESARGIPLWFPYLGSGMGKGALVELADGSIKYDLISGVGAHWGHGHPIIMEAALDAALSDKLLQGNLQQNTDSLELAELILRESKFDHIAMTSSGAMACENALKLIFQKMFPAQRLLAFDHCFMGRTTSLAQITDKPSFREGLPLNLQVDYLPFYDPSHHEESIAQAVYILKQHLTRYPKQHAALCCELIQGEGGFNVGHSAYFVAIFDILKERGIPIFVDEVQTFGRTSSLFAFQHFDLYEYVDIVTIGKISQVCATLFRDSFKPRPGLISQTFTASTSAIRAAKAVLKSLIEDGYLGPHGKISTLHDAFVSALKQISIKSNGKLRGPYGIGTMISFTVFEGNKEQSLKLIHELFHAGLIVFYAGDIPMRIRCLLPAGGMELNDIPIICNILEKTLLGK